MGNFLYPTFLNHYAAAENNLIWAKLTWCMIAAVLPLWQSV